MGLISMVIGLKDNATPTLSKMEKQALANVNAFNELKRQQGNVEQAMLDLEAAGMANTKMMKDLRDTNNSLGQSMDDLANGIKNANVELDNQKNLLPSVITSLIGWRAVIGGIKNLTGMSDMFTSSTARLNMMNDGLQTTAELQDMIYRTAQDTRVSYKGMTDTVAKLGMQAGEAFGNNNKQIIAFSGLLNKLFTTAGMDQGSIQSVMYNMTQSLSTGQLLGQDYRILKQNAPQLVSYLRGYYGVTQQELNKMVSDGKVSAQDLKNAIFMSADDINKKFQEMPVTFEQAWTKFSNTIQKILTPVLNVISNIVQGVDAFFTFLSENEYILWIVAGAITAILGPLLIYNTLTTIAAIKNAILSSTLGILYVKFALIIGILAIVAAALIYLWNTNDEVAYNMLFIWDALQAGFKTMVIGAKGILWGFLKFVETWANAMLTPINTILGALQQLGFDVAPINVDLTSHLSESIKKDVEDLTGFVAETNATRDQRVKDRKKIGYNPSNQTDDYLADMLESINSTIDPSASGGNAMRTSTNEELSIKDEDIQLLLDVATRDFKLNYQQITPEINVTFGDIHETADVDGILEQIVNEVEEVYQANLEVVPAT